MYKIRTATVDDIEIIRDIAERTWTIAYAQILSEEQLNYMLATIYSVENITLQLINRTQTYLMLTEDDKAVAFAAYSPRWEDPSIYKLHKLYCLPETQGNGYGKILINEVVQKTIEAGGQTLDLNVNRYNKAKSFYEKMGFKVAYEEDLPIGAYWMNDYVMRKEW